MKRYTNTYRFRHSGLVSKNYKVDNSVQRRSQGPGFFKRGGGRNYMFVNVNFFLLHESVRIYTVYDVKD